MTVSISDMTVPPQKPQMIADAPDTVDKITRQYKRGPVSYTHLRDATTAAPLKVKVRLHKKEKDEINEHEIFMGDLPVITETGTFVINGAERVIVSQLVRSPGIYDGIAHDKLGKTLYSCTVIPNRGRCV